LIPGLDRGYAAELDFWRGYIARNGARVSDPACWEDAFPTALRRWLEAMGAGRRQLAVLELGSGPVSLLAWGVEQRLFQLTAVDPLADEYAHLMAGCTYPVEPTMGHGEQLSRLFPRRSFDLAYSSNALDHTRDPRECMRQLAMIVKDGGLLYCEGFLHEGTNAEWEGLHQHDLVPEDGQLVAYDREGRRVVVTEALGLECVEQQVEPLDARGLTSHGYEWNEQETRDWRYDDWFTLVWRVSRDGEGGAGWAC
jgi:SAM-dependent methyltransferase